MTPLVRIGPLEVLRIDKNPNAPTVVMLHGYGANAHDLASLALEIGPRYNWVFPNGPIALDFGMFEGRAWFNIDVGALDRAMATGQVDQWMNRTPQGLEKARKLIMELIAALGVAPNNLILGGFSQGAMLAADVAIHLSESPRGLLLFSGSLMCRDIWKEKAVAKKGLKFFQSHGEDDTVLIPQTAEAMEQVLTGAGWNGSLMMFPGGHEIPRNVLKQAESFLRSL
jgi:phospholipase/carboxylesterase